MMTRLMVALLWAGLMGVAMAAEPGKTEAAPPKAEATKADSGKADTGKVDADKVIADILSVSGIKRSLEEMPKTFQDGFHSSLEERGQDKKRAFAPEDQQALESSVKESFTAEGFVGRVPQALKKDYNEKNYKELLEDLSTPLAKHMEELEAMDAPGEEVWSNFFVELKSKPSSEQRLELIKRLDMANHRSDVLSSIMLAIERGVARGVAIASGCVNERQLTGVEVSKDRTSGLKDNGRYKSQAILAYIYREVSDADLADYIKIYEKENAKHINDAIFAAINEEINQANTRMDRGFMKTMHGRQASKGDITCEGIGDSAAKPSIAQAAVKQPAEEKPATDQHATKEPAASGVPSQPAVQPAASAPAPKSSIPLEKRKGADATKCLELGSDKEIAACAEKYR